MEEIDEARPRRFTEETAAYQNALDSAKATLEFEAAEGDGDLLDVREMWIAALARKIENRTHLIAMIDRDNARKSRPSCP